MTVSLDRFKYVIKVNALDGIGPPVFTAKRIPRGGPVIFPVVIRTASMRWGIGRVDGVEV